MINDFGVPSAASDVVIAATHPPHENGGPCATCAFRPGTEANLSAHTAQLARLCVEGLRPFQCHEHPHVCRGWVAAVNFNGVPVTEDQKRWTEVTGFAADMLAEAIAAGVEADRAAGQQAVK